MCKQTNKNLNRMNNIVLYKALEVSEGNLDTFYFLNRNMDDSFKSLNYLSVLEKYQITGDKLYKLIDVSCKSDFNRFERSLILIKCEVYEQEEINNNLSLSRAVPFDYGLIKKDDYFGPMDEEWDSYCLFQRGLFLERYNERLEKHNAVGIK